MSSSFSSAFSSASTASTATSASASPLPSGCASSSSASLSSAFSGCVAENITVTATCCTEVGSSPTFTNGSCGCPFTGAFQYKSSLQDTFTQCIPTAGQGDVSACGVPSPSKGGAEALHVGKIGLLIWGIVGAAVVGNVYA
uniref:Extracellular membrane protein CFEM domain-containing protein n=1 Tax=Mycena chlorophos TaxID=658473 RepID=A0ABQ0LPR9_MYCCL|nr:predicted protein [Mycena chlorophos]